MQDGQRQHGVFTICKGWFGASYPCYKRIKRWEPYETIYDGGYIEGALGEGFYDGFTMAHAQAKENYSK